MGPTLTRRLTRLCDPGTPAEVFNRSGSACFTVRAEIGGHKALIIATEPDPISEPPDLQGSIARYLKALNLAETEDLPVVFLHDAPALYRSGQTAFQGARAELMMGDVSVGRQYYETARLFKRVPLVAAVFGHMAQAQAFPVAMCHGLVMVKDASISVARPDAVQAMLGETNDYQSLGGAKLHSSQTGTCDEMVETEDQALDWVADFLGILRAGRGKFQAEPARPDADAPGLAELIPARLNLPFDASLVVRSIVDAGCFLEIGRRYAAETVTGIACVGGRAAGILVSNPKVRGAVLFPETCRKMIRFINICDALGLPLVFLADAPGFMIGRAVEKAGIVSAGAELFAAIANSAVPRLCIVLRRAYTAGLYAMSGSGFAPQALYALPGASISVYGPEAIDRFLNNLDMPPEQKEEIRRKMAEDSRLETMVEKGYLTGIIKPQEVRAKIADFLGNNISHDPRSG